MKQSARRGACPVALSRGWVGRRGGTPRSPLSSRRGRGAGSVLPHTLGPLPSAALRPRPVAATPAAPLHPRALRESEYSLHRALGAGAEVTCLWGRAEPRFLPLPVTISVSLAGFKVNSKEHSSFLPLGFLAPRRLVNVGRRSWHFGGAFESADLGIHLIRADS